MALVLATTLFGCAPREGGGFTIVTEVVNPGQVTYGWLELDPAPCVNPAEGTKTCMYEHVHCDSNEQTNCDTEQYQLTAVVTNPAYRFDHWETLPGSYDPCDRTPTNPVTLTSALGVSVISACRAVFVSTAAPTLVSIAVTPANPSVVSGRTLTMVATGTYSDGSTANVTAAATWLAATPQVATVSPIGVVTGGVNPPAPRTTTITATVDGVSGSTTVTVTGAVTDSIAITPDGSSITVGSTQALTATGTRSDGSTPDLTQVATWSSSNDAIATVSSAGTRGVVTGHTAGTATITATADGVSDTTQITVTAAPLVIVSIDVDPDPCAIADGQTCQFVATATYNDTSTQVITNTASWACGDSAIATIDATGLATTVGNTAIGTTSCTATQDGITGTAQLTVGAAVLESITVTPDNEAFPLGHDKPFFASGTHSDGAIVPVTSVCTWTALPPARITIDTTGVASTPVGATAGAATVTCTIGTVTDSASTTVTPAVVASLVISPDDASVVVGATQPMTVAATFSDGTSGDVTAQATWLSSAPGIATVAAGGLCTVNGTGTATLTATVDGVSDTTDITGVAAVSTRAVRGATTPGGISGYIARLIAESLAFTGGASTGGFIDTIDNLGGYSRVTLGATVDPGTGVYGLPDGSQLVAGRDIGTTVNGWIARIASTGSYLWQLGISQTLIIDAIATADASTIVASYRDVATSRPGLMTMSLATGALVTQALTDLPATLDGRMRLAVARTGGDVFAANANTVFRISASGAVTWQQTFSGASFRALAATSDGGAVLVGTGGGSTGFIVRLDGAGAVVFQNLLGGGALTLNGVTQTPSGYTTTGNLTGTGAVAVLLDPAGTPTGARSYADTGGTGILTFVGVGAHPDGTIVLGARRSAEGFTGFKVAADLSLPGCSDPTLGVAIAAIPVMSAAVTATSATFAFTPVSTMAVATPTTFATTPTSISSIDACAN